MSSSILAYNPLQCMYGSMDLQTQSPTHQEMVEHHITYAYFLTVLHHDQTPIIRPHASPFQFVLNQVLSQNGMSSEWLV